MAPRVCVLLCRRIFLIGGILTAAHALDKLRKSSDLGIVRFSSTSQPWQRETFEYVEAFQFGPPVNSDAAFGPDLGFLELLPPDVTRFGAGGSIFFNFDRFIEANKAGCSQLFSRRWWANGGLAPHSDRTADRPVRQLSATTGLLASRNHA